MRATLLALAALVAAFQDGEVPVPEFDLKQVKASYVVALPDGYDGAKEWPLILDFHGAINPSRKGATYTREILWSKVVKRVPCIVVGLNGRTTAWGMTTGAKDDRAYALHVLAEVRRKYSIDPRRIYAAGFSSGSDFLCSGGLQLAGPFAASLVTCPGPSNVVGVANGSLAKAKDHPFYFVAGEEDIIRKDGAWEAFLTLDKLGGRVMYREVPWTDHAFFPTDEYARLFEYLEILGAPDRKVDDLAIARSAILRQDYLLASTHLLRLKTDEAKALLTAIEKRGQALAEEAADIKDDAGHAYEAWWRVRTQFHRFEALAARAQKELDALEKGRDALKARGDWHDKRRAKLFAFDHYLDYTELTACVRDLARRYPGRVKLHSMGMSIEGRELWVLELTDQETGAAETKPAVYAEGAIHGNEVSAMMTVLYFAWQLAANPAKSRGIDRLMATTTFYAAPAVNPDAVHHFVTEPNTHWRPRFNLRPFDSDGDGKVDEDGYEDLDGDGEIGQMYRESEKGEFVLKDGRLVRGEGKPRYEHVGREGIDNDRDGKYSEDPPGGVDLNRNFPVGFHSRKEFEGTSGAKAASEPETQAIMGFVTAHPNVCLFLDYHNDAKCIFHWKPEADAALYGGLVERAEKKLGYKPEPLDHAGAGLAIAWSYGELGVLSLIVELEPKEWKEDRFMPAKPFKHPQLGDILLGDDDRKLCKRNPQPSDIVWLAERNWSWLKEEMQTLPRLELRKTKIEKTDKGFVVTGEVANAGALPTDTGMAAKLGKAAPVKIEAEGATLSGDRELGTLAGGESRAFRAVLEDAGEAVTLTVRQPRGGTATLRVARPRRDTVPVRKEYAIEEGFATPDRAKRANNDFYKDGVSKEERGPAFKVPHAKDELKIGVLLGEWKDARHSVQAAEFERAFFGDGTYTGASATGQPVYGSVRDFYGEMSYGRVKVTGKVFDWVELAGEYREYRDENFGSDIVERRLLDAVTAREGAKALDGFDVLAFVWAGNPVNRVSALWPMRTSVKDRPGVVAFKMSELYQGQMVPIGVPCHESGHTFGVDDKYGLAAGKNPLGPWCLIATGTHGGPPSGEQRPFHFCAWCKMVVGWVKPVVIDPAEPQKLALRPILFGPGECYRILLKPDGSEYLLLENRRREGFFTDLPSPGLAVLRVGPNDRPETPQVRVQLLPAHGVEARRRGVIAQLDAVAWPQKERTQLVVEGVRLSNIRLVDDVVYFELGLERR